MKFQRYHPLFITLSDEEETEYCKWHDVGGIVDCLKIIFPAGPYEVYHESGQEEKTICVANGNKYFIESRDQIPIRHQGGELTPGYILMVYPPNGEWYVLGYADDYDGKTAEWDETKDKWRVTNGLPDKRY